jgi:hypothetical protein
MNPNAVLDRYNHYKDNPPPRRSGRGDSDILQETRQQNSLPASTADLPQDQSTTALEPRPDVALTQEPDYSGEKLTLIKFPQDMEERGTPYMLIKIYETNTAEIPQPTDEFSASIRTGANAAVATIEALERATGLGNEAAAAVAGGAFFGAAGAIGGALVGTEAGLTKFNEFANNVFGAVEGGLSSRAKNLVKNFSIRRNTTRISRAIALFMPDGINTSYDNEYSAISMTATFGVLGLATQALYAKGDTGQTNAFINEAAARIAGGLLGNEDVTRAGLFATTGKVLNPQLEMIYNTPVLRKFVFDFRLIPRNVTESIQINSIVQMLKYYSAPTIPNGVGGRYLIPPAQFEIEFYDGAGSKNPFLFKTKKCVLSGLNLDFTPNGYASHDDGAPVETRMQLTFQEVSIIDRNAVTRGF